MTSEAPHWRWRRALAVTALGITCLSDTTYAQGAAATTTMTPADQAKSVVCNSLTGPFCVAVGAMTHFSSYMTPITTESLYKRAAREDESAVEAPSEGKQCFFMHFARSWMDSGGDENDLMSKKVQSVDECEALCCEHPQCQSFSFWMDSTCFLRARHSEPREDGNSFSGNRIG